MPFEAAKLAKPQYLIPAGIALVGGLYLATKMRAPATDAALTSTPAQAVTDSGSQQQLDALNQQLMEAERKRQEALQDTQDKLANAASLSANERDQLQSRMLLDQQTSATRYDAQIAALQAQIAQLSSAKTAPVLHDPQGGSAPISSITPPIVALPSPVRHETNPGLVQPSSDATTVPGGYPPDCTGVRPRTALYPTDSSVAAIADLQRRIKAKGHHASEHIPRLESAMIAIMGVGNQSNVKAARGYTEGVWAAGSLNQVRRANGLKAISKEGIQHLNAQIVQWINNGQIDWTNDQISWLYAKFYFPYVCG